MGKSDRLTPLEAHHFFGVRFNNRAWDLLEKEKRDADENEEMRHVAHASYIHWTVAGKEVNRQRGAWLLARVYAELEEPAAAVAYAQECKRWTDDHDDQMEDFDRFYSLEALARAAAVSGNLDVAREAYDRARDALKEIKGKEDRKIAKGDLNKGFWGEFKP